MAAAELGRQAGIVTAANAAVSGHGRTAQPTPHCPACSSNVPVAVLVIDQTDRQGHLRQHRRGGARRATSRLPVDVDTWGAAAGLTDLAGQPLASTTGPLSTVAQGRPVAGEAVRLSPGRAPSSARGRRPGRRRPAAVGHRLPAVAGRQRRAARAGRLPAARPARADQRSRRLPAGAARTRGHRHRHHVLHHRPPPARQPAGLGQPLVHADHRIRGRGGRRAQLPLPAGPATDPAAVDRDPHRSGRAAHGHDDPAELPQGRHRLLEPAVHQPGLRRRGRAGQLRRRADRRHRAGAGGAGARGRLRRRTGRPAGGRARPGDRRAGASRRRAAPSPTPSAPRAGWR